MNEFVMLGVPTGYSVAFAEDGSAEIAYAPPVVDQEISPDE